MKTINGKAAKRNGWLALFLILASVSASVIAYCSQEEVVREPVPDDVRETGDVRLAYAARAPQGGTTFAYSQSTCPLTSSFSSAFAIPTESSETMSSLSCASSVVAP
ncbi:MAG: hypothetical protein LBT94_09785 [Prevotellaceae bacterium]|nr:hypothetical protein [Prevotellaceae bacterium]